MSALAESYYLSSGSDHFSSKLLESQREVSRSSSPSFGEQYCPEVFSSIIADSNDVNYLFRWEYDHVGGTMDYISKKRNNRKAPERVVCLKPSDSAASFLITCAIFNGEDVSSFYLDSLLERLYPVVESNSTVASSASLAGSSTPQSKPSRVVSGDRTQDLFEDSSSRNENKAIKVIDSSIVKLFLENFFSADDIQTCADEQFTLSERVRTIESSDNLEKLVVNTERVVTPSLFTSMEIDGPIPILISIEGNIGAGKSTLLRALRNSPELDWCFIDEPVDTWTSLRNDDGTSLLELFYGDQRRWSYTFQNCAVLSRFQNIEKTVAIQRMKEPNRTYKVFVTERCLQTDYQVFAKMMREDGKMDLLEFDLYKRWYSLIEATATPLSAIIYVDTEPDVCFDRIKTRNRDGEDGIPLNYLKSLHTFQNAMIDNANVPQCRVKSSDLEDTIKFVDSLVAKFVPSNH